MKLNPVYDFIRNHDEFTYSDVFNGCMEHVVSTHYLESAFSYMARDALIKQVDAPMPEKIIVGERIVSWKIGKTLEETFENEPVREPIYGYQVFTWDDHPEFFKMGKFHKTVEWKKEFKKMKNPFMTSPFGLIVDFDSKKFKDEYFNRTTHNDKKPREKWSNLGWEEIAERTRDEISRALYYIAVHNFNDRDSGFPLRPHDRKHQWQRVVDLGVEYQTLWYKCFDKMNKWSPQRKAREMFKMHWMVDSETENMC